VPSLCRRRAGSGTIGPVQAAPSPSPQHQARLNRLAEGFVVAQLLYAAARLGIADVLASGPQTAAALARAVGADPALLHRLLRGLVVEEVLDEDGQGRFSLTPLGACLREDAPGSLRAAVLLRGSLLYRAAPGLADTVVDGTAAWDHAYGEPFFEYLGRRPDDEARFQASMADRAGREAADVVAAYDFRRYHRLVDVGGGPAILLAAVLRAAPALEAVLLDRPATLQRAQAHLEREGVAGRARCVAGDFFVSVPEGADAYLLSRVVHDWDDADALRILTVCRTAMRPDSRLLLADAILPERARDLPEAIRMDVLMLMLFGRAGERDEASFRRLLDEAGFRVEDVVPTGSLTGLGVIQAVPAA
jgi:hypothetical protein